MATRLAADASDDCSEAIQPYHSPTRRSQT